MEKNKDTVRFDPAGAAGRGVPWLARACAFAGAIVCSGLAGPGTARGAGPVGIDVSAEVEAALAEVDAVVPQAPTREGQSVTLNVAVPPTAPATAEVDGAITEIAAATEPVATAASTPISPASLGAGSSAEAPGVEPSHGTVPPHSLVVQARSRSSSERAAVSLSARSTVMSSAHSTAEASVTSRTVLVTGSARTTRAAGARPKHNPPAGVEPQRLPPAPLPPRPDMTSSGQGGGQGSVQPLVLGALAGVLGFFLLSLLPRVLPRPAFRKPRRIVLPPWHPG
jgi:hypothetical protein